MLKEIGAYPHRELVRSDFAFNFFLKLFGEFFADNEQIPVAQGKHGGATARNATEMGGGDFLLDSNRLDRHRRYPSFMSQFVKRDADEHLSPIFFFDAHMQN